MLVNKLSEIPVHNLDAAKQTSAAITQAVLKPQELDPKTQVHVPPFLLARGVKKES